MAWVFVKVEKTDGEDDFEEKEIEAEEYAKSLMNR